MQRKERNADKAIDSRFAAMQLINDPQAFAELLFGKLQVGHMSYDTKMLCILMMCRIIGMHQLIMLNVYPFCSAIFNRVSWRYALIHRALDDAPPARE